MAINIFDGNNYYRKVLETDNTGLAPRGVLNDMMLQTEVCVWCWDGNNGNARRREIYPEYKRNRKPASKDVYAGFDLMKEILTHTNVLQVEVEGYEADDVIATLTRGFVGREAQVYIYSNDYDFAQLSAEFPNQVFTGAKHKDAVPDNLIRHYKALVGDPSDNIPGIAGFGEKAWSDLGPELVERLVHAIITDDDIDPTRLTPRVVNWLAIPENRENVKVYWDIVGFLDVPQILIDDALTVGVKNYDKADAILKRYLL